MGRFLRIALVVLAGLAARAGAQPSFQDDFEPNGIDRNIWKEWPEADEAPFSDSNHNHTDAPDATWSARAEKADPWGYAMYADFEEASGDVYAEVWIWDDLENDGMDYDFPVSCMLALVGADVHPDHYTDYLQLGVISWYDANGMTDTYSIRTRYRDEVGPASTDYVDTGVPRKEGWIKLGIAAAALADGGQVRFYIDDQLVFMSFRRAGVPLQFVRLGVNFKSHQYFYYDDVVVTDTLPGGDVLRFDVDEDGDVDQTDFATFQICYTGSGGSGAFDVTACWRMDADEDSDVDGDDLAAFNACASGPAIPADPACDNQP